MIFENLVLHNFGVYKGAVEVPLSVTPDRPIVLVGAMNGSGKTTFLDAMQLALYGKSAKCTGRERVSYVDYLKAMIHRGSPPSQGAAVDLSFRTRANGQDSVIRVSRTWIQQGQGVRESLEIYRDGTFDSVASERWQEFVEDFMPSQLADLFFFDGEKIEALADPSRSAALLRIGIHSLLGIDLIESLIKSLQQVEKRNSNELMTSSDREQLEGLQEVVTGLRNAHDQIVQEAGAYETERDNKQRLLESAAQEFKKVGGELFERRQTLLAEQNRLTKQVGQLHEQLQEIAAGVMPIALVGKLKGLLVRRAKESSSANGLGAQKIDAEQRDAELISFMKKKKIQSEIVKEVSQYLQSDRSTRYELEGHTLPLPAKVLNQIREEELDRSLQAGRRLLKELSDTEERLHIVERNLGAVPDESVVAAAQSKVDQYRQAVAKLNALIELKGEELKDTDLKLERANQKLERVSEELRQGLLKSRTLSRVIAQSVRSRASLGLFREQLLQENIDRLQKTIADCYQRLLRKQSLFGGIVISKESFQISLKHKNGAEVPSHRLSAGERQLLAVATLWALSQASGRHLPAVIDTPLSRLDSRHRGTIVRNYFPAASHQVILLSTDEEVVGKYYDQLKPYLQRQYLIAYDDERDGSTVSPGYFPEQVAHEGIAA
jgi:DNA sulfur modification protein DndD